MLGFHSRDYKSLATIVRPAGRGSEFLLTRIPEKLPGLPRPITFPESTGAVGEAIMSPDDLCQPSR